MKVSQLIEALKKLDPELPVVYDDGVYGELSVDEVRERQIISTRVALIKFNGYFFKK